MKTPETPDRVKQIAIDPMAAVYVLTEQGRLFARVKDTQATMNQRNQDVWKWVELRGPLDAS